jgi:D-beta-D-heptose 7-phosphate kinase/D-beta-D-heptose 1-phosphate adenosyltransferase
LKGKILETLGKIPSVNVLVFGDLMLDHFVYGDAARLSPEAPVPIVRVKDDVWRPGGAANAAVNIKTLGASVGLVGVVGEDLYGEQLRTIIEGYGIDVSGILAISGRITTYKARVLASRQQIVRVDRETADDISTDTEDALINAVAESLDEADAVILSDYGKGLITASTAGKVIELARSQNKIITVDPKDQHFTLYSYVSSLTPNHNEAARAVGADDAHAVREESLDKIGRRLLDMLESDSVLITCGERGMVLYGSDGSIERVPTRAREVFDVAGAGDTVIAAFTTALAAGASHSVAAHLANFAASVVVGKVGTAAAAPEEITRAVELFY